MFLLQFRYPNSGTITYEQLEQTEVRLGSAPDNTIPIAHPSISQHHAEIYRKGEKWHLKDLGSTNKTYLNDVAVVDAILNAPATLRLGEIEGTYRPSLAPAPSTPPPPFARLTVSGSGVVHQFAVYQLTIGWKSANVISLKDPSVSGQHAKITFEKGSYHLTDLGSSNKTFINGKEIQTAPLKHGDKIHFGAAEVVFELVPAAPAKPASPSKQTTTIAAPQPPAETAPSAELETLKQELDTALKQREMMEQALIEAQNQHTLALASAHTTISRLTAELDQLKKKEGASDDLAAALKKIEQLTQQREAADAEAATLAAKLDDELRHAEELAASQERLQSEVATLQAKVQMLSKERDAALERARKAELELATLRSKADTASITAIRPVVSQPKPQTATPADPAKVKAFLDKGSAALASLRQLLHRFIKDQGDTALLTQFLTELNDITQEAEQAGLAAFGNVGRTLASLVSDLMEQGQLNASTLRTVSQSVDFLVTLLGETNADPRNARLLAVEDDSDTRKVIEAALALVDLQVTFANTPSAALEILGKEAHFDLILADVGLPEMSGYELCTKIRGLENHRRTPVVFLTGAASVQNRVQSSLCGGNDLIAKPFHLLELGVRTLIWALKGQMER